MRNVSIEEINNDLHELLEWVRSGETLVLYEADRPLAEIRPLVTAEEGKGLRPYGLAQGQFTVPDDFDAPLPDDVLRAFEGP